MDKFFTFLVVLMSLGVVVVAALLIKTNADKKKKLMALSSAKVRKPDYVPRVLKINFPESKLIRKPTLPLKNENGSFDSTTADLVFICKKGVICMSLFGKSGIIDNSETGDWTITNNEGEQTFPNPLDETSRTAAAVAQILLESEIFNVPIYNVCVFYGRKITIRNASERVLTPDGLVSTVKGLTIEKPLSDRAVKDAFYAIAENARRRTNIQ